MKAIRLLALVTTAGMLPAANGWAATGIGSAGALTTNDLAPASVSAAGNSWFPQFSADGRFVVFLSHAPNLVANDDLGGDMDVFLHELATGENRLISVNQTGVGGGDRDAACPTISSNGQWVALTSAAGNLVADDTNFASDIFVRDGQANTTRLAVSRLAGGVPLAPPAAYGPAGGSQISGDGRWLLFESRGTDLVTNCCASRLGIPTNNIYLRDLWSNVTRLVSVGLSELTGGNGDAHSPLLSRDGRYAVFTREAEDPFFPPLAALSEIYLRDLESQTLLWASTNVAAYFAGSTNKHACFHAALSAEGRALAFLAAERGSARALTVFQPALLFHHAISGGITTLVASNVPPGSWPSLSADGNRLAYASGTNVYVWDAHSGASVLVNVGWDDAGPGNAPAQNAVLSPDGNRVAYTSAATDLNRNATNGLEQIFVRDLAAGTNWLVSRNLAGKASRFGHGAATLAFSPDARMLAFDSLADDLVPNDFNQASDVFVHELETGQTRLISRRESGLPQSTGSGSADLGRGAISADGGLLAFTSFDSGLVAGDTNKAYDVFLQNLTNGNVTPVSVDSNGVFRPGWNFDVPPGPIRPFGTPGWTAGQPTISSNGQFVAFAWRTAWSNGVYWFDRQIGQLRPANVATGGGITQKAFDPLISPDGRCVVFWTPDGAGAYVSPVQDRNNAADIILRDMVAETNQVLSVVPAGNATGDDGAVNLSFSPDGRWLLFASQASNLDTNGVRRGYLNLFARDLVRGTTYRVSFWTPTTYGGEYLGGATWSGDSQWIAYEGDPHDAATTPRGIYLFSVRSLTQRFVWRYGLEPSLSHFGRWIAFGVRDQPDANATNIMGLDLATGVSNLVASPLAAATPAGADLQFHSSRLSGDGRFLSFLYERRVGFQTITNALDPASVWTEGARISDLCVYDRQTGDLVLVSAGNGERLSARHRTSRFTQSADGKTLVFHSFASNLVPGDDNNERDLFVLHLDNGDRDGDRMDDDWELAKFGTLDRNGSGDFDGDRASDLSEYYAGTDPTNLLSVLRITRLVSDPAETLVEWHSVTGRIYRVQYKDRIDDPQWRELPGQTIGRTSSITTATDALSPHPPKRYYRIRLLLGPADWE